MGIRGMSVIPPKAAVKADIFVRPVRANPRHRPSPNKMRPRSLTYIFQVRILAITMPSPEPKPRETDIQASEDCLGDHPQRFHVRIAAEQHAIDVPLFPRILPSLQPVANAISRTDERNLIDQSIGHSGYRLRFAADEESLLDPNCRRLVPQALCSVIVEILVAGAHAANIERQALLDR